MLKKEPRVAAAPIYEGDFVGEFHRCYSNSSNEDRQQIMSYFDVGELPALHELARNFTICDHWFSSLPGTTWANRIFFHTGTGYGITTMPEKHADIRGFSIFDQETIYNRLTEGKHSTAHILPRLSPITSFNTSVGNKTGFSSISQFEKDAAGPE